ncbi:ABC transporter ATP-binding protein [Paenibacillus sp. FSL H7-0331]|uniref:ABC transporter ATP-binding protein n=2 Tax=Paenibacillus sp. FSL H7-0331 TaxID=1920421 RepID=UPI00096D5737|nr:ABC transporter ATP-binding protein [Paenibacillus sp. FSL H7-0331]OMF19334.1 peptide ABC transporter ATP-binding protein [Paenibacillus sp. FSL H7-0331]
MMKKKLLEVKELVTDFTSDRGTFHVVDRISFDIDYGETVGLVGESGSGKSITSLSILGLIKTPGRIAGGSILFQGEELIGKTAKEMGSVRGQEMSMIFQEPMTSLNPVLTVGEQIAETVRQHKGMSRKEAMQHAVGMLEKVGIPMPETRVKQYPHQLSGGMRQRVMIAIALSCSPKLLIADEPTTALDVTIQAQILELMKTLNRDEGTGILMVTHDLGVVAEVCEKVIVMYAGQVVEQGPSQEIFTNPLHPYTELLLKSIPQIGGTREKLYSIPGHVPSPHAMPDGCRFHARCPYAFDRCSREEPVLLDQGSGRRVSCWKYDELADPARVQGEQADQLEQSK